MKKKGMAVKVFFCWRDCWRDSFSFSHGGVYRIRGFRGQGAERVLSSIGGQ